MMKRYLLILLLVVLWPVSGKAQITLPASGNWTTSWNCGPSDFVYSSEVYFPSGYCSADNIPDGQGGGAPVGSCGGNYSGVYTAASRAATGIGRGDRQWIGPDYTNGMTLTWVATDILEFRWYQRYDARLYAGYEGANPQLHKHIYFNQGTSTWAIPEFYGSQYNVALAQIGNNFGTASISTLMDGNWHLYEILLDHTHSVVKMWIDESLIINLSVDPGGSWSSAIIGDNTGEGASWGSTCYPVDYDDIAINKTGAYIGPTGGGGGGGITANISGKTTGRIK